VTGEAYLYVTEAIIVDILHGQMVVSEPDAQQSAVNIPCRANSNNKKAKAPKGVYSSSQETNLRAMEEYIQ